MTNTDLHAVGLTLTILGLYFLAISIVFKRPRTLVREFFGLPARRIEVIKQYLLNNVQVVIAFVLLFVGYCFQLMGTIKLGTSDSSTLFTPDNLGFIVVTLLGSTVGVTVLLRVLGYYWTRQFLKRYLGEQLREMGWSLEENMAITKEIGEFLGIPKKREDTVEEYVSKIRVALNIPEPVQPKLRTSKTTKI